MRKSLITATICAVAAMSMAFAACAEASDYQSMKRGFGNINEASGMEKIIEVKNGDFLISSVVEIYKSSQNGYLVTTTTKTLNPIGEGEGMYTETVEGPVAKWYLVTGSFPAESELKNAEFIGEGENLELEAVLSSDYLAKLGLSSEDCSGEVTFASTLADGNLTDMELEYLSSNGNNVTISFIFDY